MATTNYKGFIKDVENNTILPFTRGELVLDKDGKVALTSKYFVAGQINEGITNEYGLVSAAERAGLLQLLGNPEQGDQPAQQPSSVTELQQALMAINSSLHINSNIALPFYTYTNGMLSGNTYNIADSSTISVGIDDGTISFNLAEITQSTSPGGNIVTGVTVDDYGRVTGITKTSDLSGCFVTTVGSDANVVVNKQYVDEKCSTAVGVATGALRFVNSLTSGDKDFISSILNDASEGSYYKVAEPFEIDGNLFEPTYPNKHQVHIGDTLIVHHDSQSNRKFILIPSGDDVPTTITFTDGTKSVIAGQGATTVKFASPFAIKNDIDGQIDVSLPYASSQSAGIIDSQTFDLISAATSKTMTYVPTVNNTDAGYYELGQIKFGDSTSQGTSIYGKDTTYALSLGNDSTITLSNNVNPNDKDTIAIVGNGGISVNNSQDNSKVQIGINLGTNNKYLKVADDGTLQAIISSVENQVLSDGLIDTKLFQEGFAIVAFYETIDHSLNTGNPQAPSGKNYKYGGSDLIKAITVTI